MQDPNNENTIPTHPNRGTEATVPIHIQSNTAQGTPAAEETRPVQTQAAAPKATRPRRWPWLILGILMIFVFGGAGTWLGYQAAIDLRTTREEEERVTVATEHFMLGLEAQQNKQYEIALRQFEYVIQLDPNFPGAQDKLREVMFEMAVVHTPTPAPTEVPPTLTPTPDNRPLEEIFNQARQQYANKEWEALFATIDALRRIDPSYRAVEVDGMLYMAYRFRGIDKIIHQANLEGGLYDLALAERFAPLDVDSLGYRQWARMYLNGAAFWEVDWDRVMEYFEQIYPYFPNMRDSSGLTAIERYRIAARSQAERLRASGEYCKALEYYEKSLSAVADAELEQVAAEVYLECYPPTETPTPPPTVTPTSEVPVEPTQPPAPPTQDPGSQPTDEPAQTPQPEPTAEVTAEAPVEAPAE